MYFRALLSLYILW